jgi:hypothetical protein
MKGEHHRGCLFPGTQRCLPKVIALMAFKTITGGERERKETMNSRATTVALQPFYTEMYGFFSGLATFLAYSPA